ncbi:MAG: leucine-rich repeat domain-containing protein [Spirochaetaceae bacterium]|nr:leucine-rich repeat domain-containing protein [Spirochaetaceae bacterium]
MKIVFKDSKIENGIIKVSLDGGFTFTDYEIADVKESGIPLDSSQAFDKIQIKGSANVLKNLDVVSSINTLYESDLLPEDITGIVLKDFNGKFDNSLLQKYPNLKNLSIQNGVIGSNAFTSCSLTSLTIGNGVTSIGENAFIGNSKLESITIPDSVASIGQQAFCGCTSLKSIVIPDSVTSIGDWVFYCCSKLESITIPNNVSITSISENAFYGCSSLKSIIIPDNVTSIGKDAFRECTSLTSVTLGNGVTFIGEAAFCACRNLKIINYKGTEEQWNAIDKGDEWNVYCPSDMVINYNYQG